MRVVRFLGCLSGRVSSHTSSFSPASYALPVDAEGHLDGRDETLLPSERLGANKPLITFPTVARSSRVLAGARKGIQLVEVLVGTVLVVLLLALGWAAYSAASTARQEFAEKATLELITPSLKVAVYRFTLDGKQYLVSSQGGIILHNPLPERDELKNSP